MSFRMKLEIKQTQYQKLLQAHAPCINDLYVAHMWFIDGQNLMYNGHLRPQENKVTATT